MKLSNIFLGCFFQLMANISLAQKVTFLVKQSSMLHSADSLFIAGDFNNWNPGNKKYELTTNTNGAASIEMHLNPGKYEYKITRGSWDKSETSQNGTGISNHVLKLSADTIINVQIAGWSDDFTSAVPSKNHTASENVHILDTAFFIPQLNRTRRIWIYLPPGYNSSQKKYPVLYMHDGQNLFDNATSYAGEWGVDEYMDSIIAQGKQGAIVIGIDNGLSKRMTEYNPYSFQQYGKGEGDKYVEFLIRTLKPFIDKKYRTLSDKQNTFIAGSSMGGLISLYAVLKYPSVFGGAGIFSPAFWTADGIDKAVIQNAKKMNSKLFFYAGGEETVKMVTDMQRIENEIKANSLSPVKEMVDPSAKHNEAAWQKYFPAFYEWTVLGQK